VTLDPGQVAVVYNAFHGLNTDSLFRTQWSVPAASKVIGVFWSTEDDGSNKSRGGLFNNPGAGNEVLSFRDASGAALNTVPLAEDGTFWPAYSTGSSVYLVDVTKDNTVGTNWKSARVSTDGGIKSLGPNFSTSDIGSPGWILQDASPVIGVTNAAVTGAEGTTITNSGTWSDPNVTDVVTLTANVGTVVKNADGTWSWSIAAADNVAATPVTITANDGLRGIATVSFTYAATNSAPALGVSQASVSGNVLSTLTNIGTWNDVAADTVTLTASVGTVTKNADGTWSWSLSTTVPINSQTVTITGTDEDGGSSNVTFTIDALVAVTNTKVYYKGSSFAGTGVDAALDPSKALAKSGPGSLQLSYANLINSSLGINGIVLDVAGLVGTSLTTADYSLRVSPTGAFNEAANPPSGWAAATAPSLVDVVAGGTTAASRVRFEWPDNAIANQWLQIRILPTANTGLREAQTFYIGHLLGETDGAISQGRFVVGIADINLIKPNVGFAATVDSVFDITKNKIVQISDILAMRSRVGVGLLRNITIPPAGSGAEAEGGISGLNLLAPLVGASKQPDNFTQIIEPRWTGLNYDVQPLQVFALNQVAEPATVALPPVAVSESPTAGPVDFSSVDAFFSELSLKKKSLLSKG